ncbi:SDR family NAD(P)-dependent oxidoreductase [Desulfatitalea alkaliphila]|uniref:SDR family oxidoreductase n=1 Tax=Desulfatitalea alkaliphila TaxID=2929485 RepID=A0AA41QZI7_9BACT|nr:SDR family oxidoreductase [Desulfatitalea alkaliphila]MCJ8499263.1 SDR family oxidoreductase [Desulfatitalea alkaliphila]
MFDLSGKTAIVTGATRGIGRAIAELFALHGAGVVVSSRKADACEAAAGQINAKVGEGAGSALPVPCNISHKDQLQALVDRTSAHYGQVDILVCNAAVNVHHGPSATIPDEAFAKIIDSNLKSTHWLCHMVLPGMLQRRAGNIVVVSSIAGLRASEALGAYGISKAGEIALVRNLAAEYGPHNIRVNAIAPGLIKTDFAKALWDNPEYREQRLKATPLRRIGDPMDVAGVALFLVSDASAFMTGQVLVVDGGVTV